MGTPRKPVAGADRRAAATLLGLAVGIGAILAISLAAVTPERGSEGGVELLVYSGRPNPSFELTPSEVDELMRRLDGLPPGLPPPEPPGLGYRGLLVTLASTCNGVDRVTVYDGSVRLDTPDGIATRLDSAFVESWLLGLARRHGYADLIASLGL